MRGGIFYQALDTDPARMGAVLAYIAQLYAVEKRARQSGDSGRGRCACCASRGAAGAGASCTRIC